METFSSLVALLERRAASQPDDQAYVFLSDRGADIKGLIRERITEQHARFARHIVLIRPGTLPKTTSGKIQRALARKLWLGGRFEDLGANPD
jgi:acyl-CoA synthetase (AMP-forming)/AMP-acid ligase II